MKWEFCLHTKTSWVWLNDVDKAIVAPLENTTWGATIRDKPIGVFASQKEAKLAVRKALKDAVIDRLETDQ